LATRNLPRLPTTCSTCRLATFSLPRPPRVEAVVVACLASLGVASRARRNWACDCDWAAWLRAPTRSP
jgi:hypothetical protein